MHLKIHYNPVYFWVIHCNVSFFISDFIWVILFFFSLFSWGLVDSTYFLKEIAVSFVDFFYSLILYYIYFYSNIYFLYSSNFGLILFFSNSLRDKVRLFIQDLVCVWGGGEEVFIVITCPLSMTFTVYHKFWNGMFFLFQFSWYNFKFPFDFFIWPSDYSRGFIF